MRVLKCERAQRGSCNMLLHVCLSPGFLWNMLLEDLLKFPSASKRGSRDVIFDHSANNKSVYPWVSHVVSSSPDWVICALCFSPDRVDVYSEPTMCVAVCSFTCSTFCHKILPCSPLLFPHTLHDTPLWTHLLLYPLWCLSPPPLLSFTFHLLISLILFFLYSYLSPQAEWVRCDHNSGSENYLG